MAGDGHLIGRTGMGQIGNVIKIVGTGPRNADGHRGRWFDHSGKVVPDYGDHCAPNCVYDLTHTVSPCGCLPPLCIALTTESGVVLETWQLDTEARSNSEPINVAHNIVLAGGCEFQLIVSLSKCDSNSPSIKLTSPQWECLGIAECGECVAIDCDEWKAGEDADGNLPEAVFEVDASGCTNCAATELLYLTVRPHVFVLSPCDDTDCRCAIPAWICLTVPGLEAEWSHPNSKVRASATATGWLWEFLPRRGCAEVAVNVYLESVCGECVWKLEILGVPYDQGESITKDMEQFWITSCQVPSWTTTGYDVATGHLPFNLSSIDLEDGTCTPCEACCFPGETTSLAVTVTGIATSWVTGQEIPDPDYPSDGHPDEFQVEGGRYRILDFTLNCEDEWEMSETRPDPDGNQWTLVASMHFCNPWTISFNNWWGSPFYVSGPEGDGEYNEFDCNTNTAIWSPYQLYPPETGGDGYYINIIATVA
jgi:hypothetical protein